MNKRMGKSRGKGSLVVAVLLLSLMIFAVEAYGKAGRGATVVVTMKDGLRTSGELIHVKLESILVLLPSGQDSSLDLSEILSIRVVRDSKADLGLLIGLLAGAGTGLLGGKAALGGEDPCQSMGPKLAMFYGGSLIGLAAGGIIGASAGRDLDIRVDGASPQALEASLRKMAKYARIKEVG